MELFTSVHSQVLSWGLFILRIGLGYIFIYHGVQKFSFYKTEPSEQMPKSMISLMRFLAIVEPLGGIGVIIGFLTQYAALGLAIIMAGAINMKANQMKKKFSGDGGWEFDFVLLFMSVALFLAGPGAISIDALIK